MINLGICRCQAEKKKFWLKLYFYDIDKWDKRTLQMRITNGHKRTTNEEIRDLKFLHTAALFPGKLKKASGPYFWGMCFNTDSNFPACGGWQRELHL